jgi:hypothetical protein
MKGGCPMHRDLSLELGTLAVHRAYYAYLDRVVVECPGLPRAVAKSSCLALNDAVVLTGLLDGAEKPVDVLDVGSVAGASTFLFASHPKVRRVVSVMTNSLVSEQLDDDPALGSLADVKVLNVVRAIFVDYPEYSSKVEYFEGDLSETEDRSGGRKSPADRFDPVSLDSDDGELIALIDGQHSSDGVFDDLESLTQRRPDVLIFLDDCRHRWGPFVQRGVARFLETHPDRFTFQLLADLSPGLGGSNLGVVYATTEHPGVPELVARLRGSLSERLDPLALLERQQMLLDWYRRAKEDEHRVQFLKAELERTWKSTSWRVTAPIRAVGKRRNQRRSPAR